MLLPVLAKQRTIKDYYTYRTSKRCSVHLCSLASLIRPSKHACDLAPRFPRHAVQRRFIGPPPPEAARRRRRSNGRGKRGAVRGEDHGGVGAHVVEGRHRVDKPSVGRMERNGYRRSPTRRTTQMARTSPSFAYSARALSTASTHTQWFAHRSLRFSRDFRASNANSSSCGASATSLTRAQSTPSTASRRARRPRPSCELIILLRN